VNAELKARVEEVIGHEIYDWQERVMDSVLSGERIPILLPSSGRINGRTQLRKDLQKLIDAGIIKL
jgi:hypothetical protein